MNRTRKLIGITGLMGSGKTAAAQILVRRYNFTLLRISGKMREIAFELILEPTRDFLQGIGKFMRDFDDDVWVRYLGERIKETDGSVVVDDVRRLNEYTYLKALGFKFLRVESEEQIRKKRIGFREKTSISEEDWKRWSNHLTETQVQEIPVDQVVINNESLEDLERQIERIIASWEEI
ncbi:MAG: AAA family ATPase [Candidatus Heimdallarchaeota archaeon]